MEEILNWAGMFLHVMLGVVFFMAPGVVFWLVVAGLVVVARRLRRSNLYLTLRNRVRAAESLPS